MPATAQFSLGALRHMCEPGRGGVLVTFAPPSGDGIDPGKLHHATVQAWRKVTPSVARGWQQAERFGIEHTADPVEHTVAVDGSATHTHVHALLLTASE